MIRFHGDASVWPIIKKQIKRTKKSQQIFVAIAYIGIDAAKIMPLRRGDVLVCNASDFAIKQGSTSAIALEKFVNHGVKIFNEPHLHGKVVVFPKKSFVGSANASSRSKEVLLEAVVETTDAAVVRASQRFVQRHAKAISRLNQEDIKRIRKIRVKRPEPPPPPPPLPLLMIPKEVPILKLVPIEFAEWSTAVEQEIRQRKKSIRANFFDGGSSADIMAEEWHSDWWSEYRPGMWCAGVTKSGRIYAPKRVIKLSKVTKNSGILWLAVPKKRKSFIKDEVLLSRLGFDWEADVAVVLRNERTRSLLKQFRNR